MAYDITDEMIASFPHQYEDTLQWAKKNNIRINYLDYSDFHSAECLLGGRTFNNILEIGVLWGGGSLLLSHFVKPGGTLIGIDSLTALSQHPENVRLKMLNERIIPVFDYITGVRSISARFERSSSHEWLTTTSLTFDMIHVDAAHDIESFFRDIILAYSILNDEGMLLIDDCSIWGEVRGSAIGWRLIQDRVAPNYSHNNQRYGIITKNKTNDDFILPLVGFAKVWSLGR